MSSKVFVKFVEGFEKKFLRISYSKCVLMFYFDRSEMIVQMP